MSDFYDSPFLINPSDIDTQEVSRPSDRISATDSAVRSSSESSAGMPVLNIRLPQNPERTCIPPNVFKHFDIEVVRDYAKQYGIADYDDYSKDDLISILFQDREWIPPIRRHVERGLTMDDSGIPTGMDKQEYLKQTYFNTFARHFPSPEDDDDSDFSDIEGEEVDRSAAKENRPPSPPPSAPLEFVWPPNLTSDELQRLAPSGDIMYTFMTQLQLNHITIQNELREAEREANDAAAQLTFFSALFKKEQKESEELYGKMRTIVGPDVWAMIVADVDRAMETGKLPFREEYGDPDILFVDGEDTSSDEGDEGKEDDDQDDSDIAGVEEL